MLSAERTAAQTASISVIPELPFFAGYPGDRRYGGTPQSYSFFPQQFLYFFPEPHGHRSFLPIFGVSRRTGSGFASLLTDWADGASFGIFGCAAALAPPTEGVASSFSALFASITCLRSAFV